MTKYKERDKFLELIGESHERFNHTLDGDYEYLWQNMPDTEMEDYQKSEIENNEEKVVVTFTSISVTLHPDYSWNGSNIVGDTKRTLRASAVHDAWCQAMSKQYKFYKRTRRNWMKGADEYREVCKEDGFGWFRRNVRWLAIRTYGLMRSFG